MPDDFSRSPVSQNDSLNTMDALDVLIDHAKISRRIAEMAREIEADLNGEPVILVGILKGSIHFLSDLGRYLKIDAEVDFMQAKSYEGTTSTGNIRILKDLDCDIANRNVIIVEDIVDTGLTISHLLSHLRLRRPRTLRVASLLSKPGSRKVQIEPDYLGFSIPNEFVVGYGLDFDERYRNLPYIAIYRESQG
jgi:hypoxanthine phosphoribosyltransferase